MASILVVEDSPTLRYTVGKLLTERGYEVILAGDGEEAMAIAGSSQPLLIILDLILPRINGYQVCRRLKAEEETRGIPVIMLTSKSKDSEREWGLAQGADGYLVKPVNPEKLFNVVNAFIPEGD